MLANFIFTGFYVCIKGGIMNVTNQQNQTAFSARFINNQAFRDVVNYAEKTKQLTQLDGALNRLKNANSGDILLIHGKIGDNVYSNFNMGKRSLQNLGAETPEKASFDAIIELGKLERKFRKLIGGDVKSSLNGEDLIKKYSV